MKHQLPGVGRHFLDHPVVCAKAMNHRGVADDDPTRAAPGSVAVSLFEAQSARSRCARPVNPLVEENMLSDDRDLVRLRDGARRLFRLVAHPAITGIAESVDMIVTGTPVARAAAMDHADLDGQMLAEASDAQHAVGTYRMSGPNDAQAVVGCAGSGACG